MQRGSRSHYRSNHQKYVDKNRTYKSLKRETLRKIANEIKSTTPCADCGHQYGPWVMQFDHVRGTKRDDVSRMVNHARSEEDVRKELAKCEVVCANCHAERTHRRRAGSSPVVGAERRSTCR